MKKEGIPLIKVYLLTFCVSAGTSAVAPFLPLYWSSVTDAATGLAWILAGYYTAKIASGYFGGRFSVLLGCVAILRIGALLCMVSAVLFLFITPSPVTALFLQLIYGAGIGLVKPMSTAYVGSECPSDSVGRAVGWMETGFYVSLSIGPFIGGFALGHFGFNGLFSMMLLLNGGAFIISLMLKEVNTEAESRASLKLSSEKLSLMFYVFCRTFGISALSVFLPFYLIDHFNMNMVMIGVVTSVAALCSAVIMPFSGSIVDRFEKHTVLMLSTFVISLGLVIMPFIHSEPIFWVLMLICASSASFSKNASITMLLENGTKAQRSYLMGVNNTFMNVGFAVASFMGGYVVKAYPEGVNYLYSIAGLIGLVGLGAYYTVLYSYREDEGALWQITE